MQERLATTQTDKHSDFKLGQWNLSGQKEFKKKKNNQQHFHLHSQALEENSKWMNVRI